jgi:hypothetical protein
MPQPTPLLDLTLTTELYAECVAFLSRITEYSPTLVLLKGTRGDDPVPRWTYAAYGPNLDDMVPAYERRGIPLLYRLSELTIAIPQQDLVRELEGKTLARGPNGIEVRNRGSGI